ncbi:uncharacterized protein Z519_11073 [Cladophialophora bantiana CBS 173.52]|uniref:Actin-like ATPase domain-containing protein n=1 Tax=Cladophialophora bantiana (strain ATCC 10958 / CBS 173.52 / CDC B-1940 / NIH 8579) TaxID=1442370 RepID=A0A0D2HVF7_CLAB1|nr:uncharacterized protein Z519_11073 [Cladophialophora bantiana CBS 173.52]KIW88504.1 hypothetical protein Z519_11073 [Cladophialophora bantiana CBS 173.52]
MLDTAIKSLERQTSQGAVQGIDEIIVVGGVSQNRYFLGQIRNRYSGGLRSLFRYAIPVTLPPEAASGSLTVAHGAVLPSAERDLIKERYLRRSFCVGRHDEIDRRMYPAESWYTSPQNGHVRVNVTRFLFRQGFHPQRFSSAPFQGWRGLIPDDMEDGSWLIQEQLYYSDTLSQDGLWIDDPTVDIQAMPAPLSFRISSEEARLFPRERGPTNAEWFYLEYDLILSLDGHIMTFIFTIPKKGRFPKRGDRYANVMRKAGHYDTAGVSKLFNSA